MSDYTKGPWEVGKGAGWFIKRPDAVGRREVAMAVGMSPAVTLVHNPDPWFDDAEAEANARLMAAAPELLEALKALCDSLRLRQGSKLIQFNHDELMALIPKARAAIAKAEGAR